MSYSPINQSLTKEELKAHEAKWGRFNDVPPNFKELTEEEFARAGFFTWCKVGIEFRQITWGSVDPKVLLTSTKGLGNITLFYMNHGENFGISSDYNSKKIRYFSFADCRHTYRGMTPAELSQRNIKLFRCTHAQICSQCGYVWVYDSSD